MAPKKESNRTVPKVKSRQKTTSSTRRDTYHAQNIGTKAVVVQGQSNVKVTIREGVQSEELAALFDKVHQSIESLPEAQAADKKEISENVQRIENEMTEKGGQADESRLQRWMDNINKIAPDIVDVIIASLGGPISAATAILKKVAERARQPATTA
jgi:hypothetical protein